MSATLIFDFDGTLSVGNGPVLAYARYAAETADDSYLSRVDVALAAYEAGEGAYRDGYDVVGSLARKAGVDEATLSAAYEHSRKQLGSDDAPVQPAEGLLDLLSQVGPAVRLVLATNAPEDGVLELLTRWGLDERFPQRHFRVGKPTGLEPIIRNALRTGPVLSIGDVYDLDLAPAAALGADTALVGATAPNSSQNTTFQGRTLPELVPHILAWSAAATSSKS